jgi:hypothetical protein
VAPFRPVSNRRDCHRRLAEKYCKPELVEEKLNGTLSRLAYLEYDA